MMQNEDGLPVETQLPSGRVNAIRQQWALHEDEALAHKLQDEEITQHYCGNRTRNATVREDVPRAREEQRREEEEALELRFKQLRLLQQQAEGDARIARQLSEREKAESAQAAYEGAAALALEVNPSVDYCDLDFDILDRQPCKESEQSAAACGIESLLLLGAASGGAGHNENLEFEGAVGLSPSATNPKNFMSDDDFHESKILQEESDAVIAKNLQDEMELLERDRMLAIEAQDRELAKIIHEKEKARLKRAKERAKLKAAAAANSNPENQMSTASHNRSENMPPPIARPVSSPERGDIPPRIPGKTRSTGLDSDDPIGFRAAPKALPPQPTQFSSNGRSTSSNYSASDDRNRDPIPPYMPMQGFNLTPRRK